MKRWYNYGAYAVKSNCRFCDHSAYDHMEIKNFGTENIHAKWDKCSGTTNHTLWTCDCPGFAPVDNLLYLEMKADER